MKKLLNTEQILAITVALARLAVCWYRATHQSLVDDEAFTFNEYVRGPWSSIWRHHYDANNHVLYSILAKASVRVLGLSELTLRLPSLLAGFFLVLGVFWLLQRTRSVAIRWVAFLIVC